jgi:hypothetical protein
MTATAQAAAWVGIRLPHLGWRALVGVVLFVLYVVLFVALPLYALSFIAGHGIVLGPSVALLEFGGLVLAALGAAVYVTRPTRAYGPMLMGRSVAGVVYLLLLAPLAALSVPLNGQGSITLSGSELVLWIAVVPLLSLGAAVFVTASDARDPTVRLRREFPG